MPQTEKTGATPFASYSPLCLQIPDVERGVLLCSRCKHVDMLCRFVLNSLGVATAVALCYLLAKFQDAGLGVPARSRAKLPKVGIGWRYDMLGNATNQRALCA